ncbi:hypothetical protein Nepgr_026069 [Nepenthes gracilis]|uniref:Uncharacterized protein n=1 Tax=Nepenthes gracilis TaxID=150966 RepID=A0AAD3Y244_NEPGR|nr:hypothetical protein Nepgr_026069 [Nepenthes gracilis]
MVHLQNYPDACSKPSMATIKPSEASGHAGGCFTLHQEHDLSTWILFHFAQKGNNFHQKLHEKVIKAAALILVEALTLLKEGKNEKQKEGKTVK